MLTWLVQFLPAAASEDSTLASYPSTTRCNRASVTITDAPICHSLLPVGIITYTESNRTASAGESAGACSLRRFAFCAGHPGSLLRLHDVSRFICLLFMQCAMGTGAVSLAAVAAQLVLQICFSLSCFSTGQHSGVMCNRVHMLTV